MKYPDVVGFTLGEAKTILEKEGIVIGKITVLTPPREKSQEYEMYYRVIRQIQEDTNSVELQISKPLE